VHEEAKWFPEGKSQQGQDQTAVARTCVNPYEEQALEVEE
jgi:hypothetical protein